MATIRLMDEVECPTSGEVHAWLRAHGWVPILSPHPAWLRWAFGNRYTEIPADDTFDDWPRRVAEACAELGVHHQQSAASVAREMAHERMRLALNLSYENPHRYSPQPHAHPRDEPAVLAHPARGAVGDEQREAQGGPRGDDVG